MQMQAKTALHTNGRGYWSKKAKRVQTTRIELVVIGDPGHFAEMCVYFTPESWDVEQDGLIYTDSKFKSELHAYLCSAFGFTDEQVSDVTYSEQGMQGRDYVSLDVGNASFIAKFVDLEQQET
jgi:hypothetical protein